MDSFALIRFGQMGNSDLTSQQTPPAPKRGFRDVNQDAGITRWLSEHAEEAEHLKSIERFQFAEIW